MFLGCATAIAVGTLGRYGHRAPVIALCLTIGASLGAYIWFMFVDVDVNWRILATNFGFGTILLLLAAELRAVPGRRLFDNLLLGAILLLALSYYPRPIVLLWIDGPITSEEGFHQSLYWIAMTVAGPLSMLICTLALMAAIVKDIIDDLRRESATDPLSGLQNRRGFEEGMARGMREARRKGLPAVLVVCDLDHFKQINDNFGHGGGDQVIAAFADCLRGSAGSGSVVGRVGGEEFAIFLLGANLGTGRLFAEGARAAFTTLAVPGLPEDLRCTASFGVAELGPDEDVEELFARADDALYQAKRDGRDCVRLARSTAGDAGVAPVRRNDVAAGG